MGPAARSGGRKKGFRNQSGDDAGVLRAAVGRAVAADLDRFVAAAADAWGVPDQTHQLLHHLREAIGSPPARGLSR